MFVKPKAGYKILDPRRKDRLPPEGRDVDPNDLYWATLLRDGDVVPVQPAAKPQAENLAQEPKSSSPEA